MTGCGGARQRSDATRLRARFGDPRGGGGRGDGGRRGRLWGAAMRAEAQERRGRTLGGWGARRHEGRGWWGRGRGRLPAGAARGDLLEHVRLRGAGVPRTRHFRPGGEVLEEGNERDRRHQDP